MKPRVTDGLDGRSLFDVGYLGVFLEIFSSLPGLATMFPFFSPDRQTMSSSSFLPFFLGGSFAGRNGKSQKIDESAFYINIFKEISFLGFTRWQAIMRYGFKCGTKMNSRLNFCRERKRERCMCAYTRSTYEIAFNQLFVSRVAMSHRSETRPLKLREDIAKNDANLFRGNRVFC